MPVRTLRNLVVVGVALVSLAAVRVAAQQDKDVTVDGFVTAVEAARVQVRTDEGPGKVKPVWFKITAQTTVFRGGQQITFAAAQAKKGDRISVTQSPADVLKANATQIKLK